MRNTASTVRLDKPISSLYEHLTANRGRSESFELDSEVFTSIVQHLKPVFLGALKAFEDKNQVKISNNISRLLSTQLAVHLSIYRDSGRFSCSPSGIADVEDHLWRKFYEAFEIQHQLAELDAEIRGERK